MTTGTGLALLGVWLLPAAAAFSPHVTGTGLIAAVVVAVVVTIFIS